MEQTTGFAPNLCNVIKNISQRIQNTPIKHTTPSIDNIANFTSIPRVPSILKRTAAHVNPSRTQSNTSATASPHRRWQTTGLQQAPPLPKEGFGVECKYNWRLLAGSASQALRLGL